MRMKRQVGIGVFVVALLVVGGLIYSTFGRPATVVADEAAATEDAAAASEEAQPTGVVIAGVEYPVNEYGLSYGDTVTVFAAVQAQVEKDVNDELEFDDLLAFAPDLVEAKTNEGEAGYISAESYLRKVFVGLYAEKLLDKQDSGQATPEDALKIMSEASQAERVLTVYAADGMTAIGVNGYAEDEAAAETKKYEDERNIYVVTTYTYPNGTSTAAIQVTRKDTSSSSTVVEIEDEVDSYGLGYIESLPEIVE